LYDRVIVNKDHLIATKRCGRWNLSFRPADSDSPLSHFMFSFDRKPSPH
jgi:hypothetical protein